MQKIFSQKGAITDVDIKRNSQGRSRHFAFIGFYKDSDAYEAIRTLNHTYINMNKIQVEKCVNLSAGNMRILSPQAKSYILNILGEKRTRQSSNRPPMTAEKRKLEPLSGPGPAKKGKGKKIKPFKKPVVQEILLEKVSWIKE